MQDETVVFSNRNGRRLVGTLTAPGTPRPLPAVLVIHGFRGNRNERHIVAVADSLAWAGFATLRIDLTNNLGDSQGEFQDLTVGQEVRDAQDALQFLGGRPEVDASKVGITGHSLGGMVASLAAVQDPSVRAVVALSAVFDMAEKLPGFLGEDHVRTWRDRGCVEMDPPGCGLFLNYGFYEDLLRHDVAAEMARLHAPIRIVHGEADTSVPVEDARLYQQHVASPEKDLVLIPGADHGYSRDQDLVQVCLYTAEWFRRHLLGPAPEASH